MAYWLTDWIINEDFCETDPASPGILIIICQALHGKTFKLRNHFKTCNLECKTTTDINYIHKGSIAENFATLNIFIRNMRRWKKLHPSWFWQCSDQLIHWNTCISIRDNKKMHLKHSLFLSAHSTGVDLIYTKTM